MDTVFSTSSWEEALRGFLLHKKAVRAAKTVRFYAVQLGMLSQWAKANSVPLDKFGERRMDEYLAYRKETGHSETTLHHDELAAKVFMKWCQRNNLIERSLLADRTIRDAPTPDKYMPSEEDMKKLLAAVSSFWDPTLNSTARYVATAKRSFHRERNYAIVLTLLDSACRIGEVLSLQLDDYRPGEWQLTVRESKGREPRSIPVSPECAKAIGDWIKVRKRIMKDVPKEEDEGWLFISETGTRIDEGRFLKTLKRFTRFAELSGNISLHSLRRFSLNRLAKNNLLAAQAIAGHKDAKTTLIYTKIDPSS